MRQEYPASLELIAELGARNLIVECGYPTLAELLRDVLRITRREAKRRIEHTRAVAEVPVVSGGTVPAALPATAEALREGDLARSRRRDCQGAVRLPSRMPDEDRAAGEATLVTAARSMDARTLDKVAGRPRAVLDQDGAPPDETELAEPVTVPLRDPRTGIGSALLDGAGHLDATAARRIACDCKLIPAVLGAHSEPLDVGRSSYTVTSALRRALILWDRGCAFPGCDRPPRQCHAHHITGRTGQRNPQTWFLDLNPRPRR